MKTDTKPNEAFDNEARIGLENLARWIVHTLDNPTLINNATMCIASDMIRSAQDKGAKAWRNKKTK